VAGSAPSAEDGTNGDPAGYPAGVLAAAVLATTGVSFVLVGSAALWLRGEPIPVGDADVVTEPGEQNMRRARAAPWYAYPVLVDLAQPWKMPVTLVDGQGNFGSRGNDPAASRRYTESRLTEAGRVERCRADLTDPRLEGMPVHAIGARWGFRSPADFSRAFRAAHGIPPGDYRRQALVAGRTADAE
jgi:AraC-like DNA-binding protein